MQYAAVLLKPDAMRDRLEHSIVEDLQSAGFEVLLWKYWYVPKECIRVIHPDLDPSDPYLPYMERNYAQGLSLVLLVCYAEKEDIHIVLRRLKGSAEIRGSIRFRYCSSVPLYWEDANISFNHLVDRRTVENRIHAPDTAEETIAVLQHCFTPPELLLLPNNLWKYAATHIRSE